MIPAKSPKLRKGKCSICKQPFEKRSMRHIACGVECAQEAAKRKREKLERRDLRLARQGLKSRSRWLGEAQTVFNKFIRERDANQPCISCGRFHEGAYDAGHYRSVGSMPALRFHEDNCHKQCVPCNQHKAGNVVEYRIHLLEKIGADRLAFLEGAHEAAKYTIEDAKRIKAEYRAKLKALVMGKGVE